MPCNICTQGLEGMWGPSRLALISDGNYPRLSLYGDVEIETDPELKKYVYKHHHTRASFRASQKAGCVICTGCKADLEDESLEQDKMLKSSPSDYFSTFRVSYTNSLIFMYVWYDYGRRSESFSLGSVESEARTGSHTREFGLGSSTSDERSWSQIRKWLSLCLESHPQCQIQATSNTSYLPTRILEISGPGDSPTSLKFRLVDREECPPGSSYMTLSYCWGPPKPADQVYCLRNDNDTELRKWQSLASVNLPKTLQHAIEAAKRLRSRYLWIDRLCIIQNSEGGRDWQVEAGHMADVYKNARLSIAAIDCIDDEGSLFGDRDPCWKPPAALTIRTKEDAKKLLFIVQAEDTSPRSLFLGRQSAPLLSRGWVVQERVLAPRVVYFGRDQLFWECISSQCCEARPKDLSSVWKSTNPESRTEEEEVRTESYLWKPLISFRHWDYTSNPHQRLFQGWNDAVEVFARCNLTFASDKLVAISGLANEMRRKLTALEPGSHPYAAGLWEETLPECLLWSVPWEDSRPSRRVPECDYRAPSWSWACLDGPLDMAPNRDKYRTGDKFVTSSISCTIVPCHHNMDTGKIDSGTIELKGPLMVAHVDIEAGGWLNSTGLREKEISWLEPPTRIVQASQTILNTKWERYGDDLRRVFVIFDTQEEQPVRIFFLVVRKYIWYDDVRCDGLALVEDGQKGGVYRRIGLVNCYFKSGESWEGLLQKVPMVQITIV